MNTLAQHDTYIKYIVRNLDIMSDSQADPVSFLSSSMAAASEGQESRGQSVKNGALFVVG